MPATLMRKSKGGGNVGEVPADGERGVCGEEAVKESNRV